MTMEKFESGLAEILEVDAVNESDILEDFETWDSLTSLSIIAFIDENYGISVSANDLVTAKTVGGLKDLVSTKARKG